MAQKVCNSGKKSLILAQQKKIVRCKKCGRRLFDIKGSPTGIEIKCPRCGTLNKY
jgi:ribosomal protein L37E